MNDIDALLARLRDAAAAAAPADSGPAVAPARPWFPAQRTGVRDALIDDWAGGRKLDLVPFLVTETDDFVGFAFLYFVGRAPDPGGRAHYLGLVQQGRPRLEVVADLRSSPEAAQYRGKPKLPLWLHVLLRSMRLPFPLARRGGRFMLRRVERYLAQRARLSPKGLLWRLAAAVDEQNRARDRDLEVLARDLGGLAAKLAAHAKGVADQLTEVDGRLTATDRRLAQLDTAHAAARARIAVLEQDATAAPAPAAQARLQPAVGTTVAAAGATRAEPLTRYYLALEAAFRGDPERIRHQLETDYLAVMNEARQDAGDGPCIDLGCGRGEWLDVLRAHGYAARGVDLNPYMAADAAARGNDVTVADALEFLAGLPPDSVLAISAFHLAEHLEFGTLYALIAQCRRVLKAHGRLILETPNPENVWVATHTFHHDPSHRNPLTPGSLEFLVNHHGLETVAVLRLHPYPEDTRLPGHDPASERLNGMTCGPQDFAVVARKTAPA
jgi:SAM-dependent methyltransferase